MTVADIRYELIRSRKRRKTFSLHVKEDGRVLLLAPYTTSRREIEEFFEKNREWVIRKLREKEGRRPRKDPCFLPGEEFLYLGESYGLEISETTDRRHPLTLSFGRFVLHKDRVGNARDLFIEWYKKRAEEKVLERVRYYSDKLQLFPTELRITSAKHRWGSCSADDRLCFTWRIVMLPIHVFDYILIHELIHIREKNHSKRFWDALRSILPNYRQCRVWLRENQDALRF